MNHDRIVYDHTSPELRHLSAADPRLAALIRRVGPLHCDPVSDPFDFVAGAIVGQMLSARVADVITARLTALCGNCVSPQAVLALDDGALTGIGLSRAKAASIRALAETVMQDPGFFDRLDALPDEAVTKELTRLRGIGSWTAKMVLLFALNRPDVLPFEDGALQQVFRWLYETNDASRPAIEEKASAWKPYSSLAARYLYLALDNGLVSASVTQIYE